MAAQRGLLRCAQKSPKDAAHPTAGFAAPYICKKDPRVACLLGHFGGPGVLCASGFCGRDASPGQRCMRRALRPAARLAAGA